jgi:D-alanyl-D-alanine carboxypeptidase (penicillin-binding protein 5/6)
MPASRRFAGSRAARGTGAGLAARPARLLVALLLLVVLVIGTPAAAVDAPAPAPTPAPPAPAVPGEPLPLAYLVADAETGAVIAAHAHHEPLRPASTMKLMTALVGLERLPLSATLQVSALAAAQPAMKITMREGETWRMIDALHALLMASANDAAYAIAENASGSVEQFAADMQSAARRFGLTDSTLSDPAGLDGDGEGFNGGSRVSAHDLAVIARNALVVPVIRAIAQRDEYHFAGPDGVERSVPNHNDEWLAAYDGATGLKPGFTELANRTLVATATREDRTCIAVVLGIYDVVGWATRLQDQCFATPVAAQRGSERLPDVRVATVDARTEAVTGFPRMLGAPPLAVAPAAGAGDAAPDHAARRSRGDGGTGAASAEASERPRAPSLFSLRNLAVAALILLVLVVVLRRRAVKQQRRRRLARQRMLADARRRGVLQVLEPDAAPHGAPTVAVVRRTTRRPPPHRPPPNRSPRRPGSQRRPSGRR